MLKMTLYITLTLSDHTNFNRQFPVQVDNQNQCEIMGAQVLQEVNKFIKNKKHVVVLGGRSYCRSKRVTTNPKIKEI